MIANTPPMGWNSWDCYGAAVTEDIVRANADYMANFASKWYVLFFYVLNFLMVGADIVMYIRNLRLDKERENEADR